MASFQLSGPVSWNTSGLPSRSLKQALMPGRSGVPVTRAWPVTGFWLRHIVVVKVQPISRTSEPSSDSSIFWPMPVVARMGQRRERAAEGQHGGQISSATDAMPVRICWPGME